MKALSVDSVNATAALSITGSDQFHSQMPNAATGLNVDEKRRDSLGAVKQPLRICVAAAAPEAYSETFIRDHILRLPGEVKALRGDWPNWRHDSQRVLPLYWLLSNRLAGHISPKAARRVRQVGERHLATFLRRSEVVLAEFGTTGACLTDSCQIAKVPLVVHFHGFDAYHSETLNKFRFEYPKMFRNAAAFVVVSQPMLEQIVCLGAPRERVHVNSCGVDISQFREAQAGANPPHFFGLGRFVEKKAPHLTILAFERAFRRYDEIRLTLAGDGPLLDSCRILVRALRLEHAVDFPGVVKHDGVSQLMSGARAFVQHSVMAPSGDSEGNPVAILEAGASGLPVVSTRHAGITDTVIHGQTGFLSAETDIDSMADHILLLARRPDLATTLGRNARERMKTVFSMEGSIGRLYSIVAAAAGEMSAH